MSIYGTWLSLGDDEHEDGCAFYVEREPGVFDFSGQPCDCGTPRAPIIYEGSHVLPGDGDDRRGGFVDVAAIPDYIYREDRIPPYDFLRLMVGAKASRTQYQGKPYIEAGQATVVLTRRHVEELRDTLTAWLDREVEVEYVASALTRLESS